MLVLGCIAAAALSLLVVNEPTYDPTAWLIWGRQIFDGTLVTTAGPSWKPLPVAFTGPFSLFGDDAAIQLWLVVARVGGLLALVYCFKVVREIAGTVAGVLSTGALLLANQFAYNWIRGNSEGWLVAFSLIAVERHLAGRREQAFAAGVGAALLRPDVWPLLALYGLWLLRDRLTVKRVVVIVGAGAGVILAWFVPEYVGSGDLFRGASRAQEKVAGSPGASDSPFVTTFTNSVQALSYPVYAGAVLAVLGRWRDRRVLAIAVASTVLMVIVAALASSGFTGNLRYVTLPFSLLCVLSGIGWVWLAGELRERLAGRARVVLAVLAAASAPGVVVTVVALGEDLDDIRAQDRLMSALPGFIEDAGGRDAVKRCGQVVTGPLQTQILAYRLHTEQEQIGLRPGDEGAVLAHTGTPLARDEGFPLTRRTAQWTLRQSC